MKIQINSNQFKSIQVNSSQFKKVLLVLIAFVVYCEVQAQLKVESNGTVNIGSGSGIETIKFFVDGVGERSFAPDNAESGSVGTYNKRFYDMWAWEYNGYVYYNLSDSRLKENVENIDSALDKIINLKGQKYDFKIEGRDSIRNEKKVDKLEKARKNHLGFIAQDVLNIVPEAVRYDDKNDTYYLNYDAFIPVIVEAIKEQQATIESLEARIANLEGIPTTKSATIDNTTSISENAIVSSPTLGQNIPNPFSESTRIDIYLPTTVSQAMFYVYNLQGAQVKALAINQRGNTNVIIEGYTLDAGMYLYTLIADGKEVDTKRMILTK